MASMSFDIEMKGADEAVAYFRALNDGVEALSAGDHEKARECFDRADEVVAALKRRERSGHESVVVISLGGAVAGDAFKRVIDAGTAGAGA